MFVGMILVVTDVGVCGPFGTSIVSMGGSSQSQKVSVSSCVGMMRSLLQGMALVGDNSGGVPRMV